MTSPKWLEVNETTFSLLFSELVRYSQQRVEDVRSLEIKLEDFGFDVGSRALEVIAARDRPDKRELRIVQALQFVTSQCWTSLFGKPADALEKSLDGPDTYLISERDPLPARFASVPKDMGSLNLAAFSAGVIRGLMDAQGFPCQATAHFSQDKNGAPKVVYVVKFEPQVMEREARLARFTQ